MRVPFVATAVAVLLAGGGATAQLPAAGIERCEALHAVWERHLGKNGDGQQANNLEAKGALDQCRRGNIDVGIRALEKALRANGFKV